MIRPQSIQASQRDRTKEAQLCDLLAEGNTLAQCARILGMARSTISKRFARICDDLGEQAA